MLILHDSRLKLEAGVKKRSWTGKMMLTGNGTERDKGGLCCVGICKRSRCFYNITAKYLSTAFVKRQALAAAASKIPGGPLPSNGCSFPVCAKKNAGEWGLRWSNRPSCGVCHCYWREEQQDRCVGADGGWMVAQAKLISALKKTDDNKWKLLWVTCSLGLLFLLLFFFAGKKALRNWSL